MIFPRWRSVTAALFFGVGLLSFSPASFADLVLTCTDPSITAGQQYSACPASSTVWVDANSIQSGSPWTALDQEQVMQLASGAVALLCLAFAFRVIRKQMVR